MPICSYCNLPVACSMCQYHACLVFRITMVSPFLVSIIASQPYFPLMQHFFMQCMIHNTVHYFRHALLWNFLMCLIMTANAFLNIQLSCTWDKSRAPSPHCTSSSAALKTGVMKRLLGPADDTILTSTTTMRGLLYALVCSQVQPSQQQLEQVHMLLVAWHLTEAWLPGRVGYNAKKRLVQASSAGCACQKHESGRGSVLITR